MSEERVLIEKVQSQIADLEQQIERKKAFINELCDLAELPPIYELSNAAQSHGFVTQPDAYYGKPTATAVTLILEKRKNAKVGAATINELYDELCRGGFHFEAKNAENAKRGLNNMLGKNPKFHRLPNGTYGLREWYENIREKKNGRDQEKPASDQPLHEELQERSADGDSEEKAVKITAKAR